MLSLSLSHTHANTCNANTVLLFLLLFSTSYLHFFLLLLRSVFFSPYLRAEFSSLSLSRSLARFDYKEKSVAKAMLALSPLSLSFSNAIQKHATTKLKHGNV